MAMAIVNGGRRKCAESAVPGAYEQSCTNLDERRFVLRTPGAGTLVVYQGTNTAGGGGVSGRTGGERDALFRASSLFEADMSIRVD